MTTERSFEVVVKATNSRPRVTITKDRTTVKFSDTCSAEEIDRAVAFVLTIEDEVRAASPGSMRGRLNDKLCQLTLSDNSGKHTMSFSLTPP